METAAPIRGFRTLAEAELSSMARNLVALATLAMDYPNAVKPVSKGFLELAGLAHSCGKARICMASRALSSVLNRLDKAPEGDASFILDTVVNFLETVEAGHDWRTVGAA